MIGVGVGVGVGVGGWTFESWRWPFFPPGLPLAREAAAMALVEWLG